MKKGVIDHLTALTLILYVTGQQNRIVLVGFHRRRIAPEAPTMRTYRHVNACNRKIPINIVRLSRRYTLRKSASARLDAFASSRSHSYPLILPAVYKRATRLSRTV